MKSTLTLTFLLLVIFLQAQKHTYHQKIFHEVTWIGKTVALASIVPEQALVHNEQIEEFDHIQRNILIEPRQERPMVSQNYHQSFMYQQIEILQNFPGVSNVNNSPNPDTEGDVGSNHYIQMVKSSFAIWNREGELLYGPAGISTLWNSLIGPWHGMGWTDPIVVYDQMADRWLMSAMVYDLYNVYYEMVAVSATPDPLGSWNCYALEFDEMPDYPKFGVWPDGYYLTFNHYELTSSASTFTGAGLIVFNRDELIDGIQDPTVIYFRLDAPNNSIINDPSSFLPADNDGTPTPEGRPNYLICLKDDAWGYAFDQLWLWGCTVDWEDTSNCLFYAISQLQTEAFDARYDYTGSGWIHQPGTSVRLHGHGHFMMFRLQYRNMGGYEAMVCSHAVNVGNDQAGMRWYELRNEGSDWNIFQQGTFAPDGESRWMGSVAMDKDGNIGLGYSISGDATYPSIRVTGRNQNDPPGTMTFAEAEIATGAGNQSYNSRWGDYSMMAVDPNDDLTFWYTQQYLPTTSWNSWTTSIASFQLQKNLSADKDSLAFITYDDCTNGLTVRWKNTSSYPVEITDIEQTGFFGNTTPWIIDPWNITLPLTLQTGDSLDLNIIVVLGKNSLQEYFYDTLSLVTEYTTHRLPMSLNGDLLVGIQEPGRTTAEPLVKLHPNPFTDQIICELTLTANDLVSISVYNVNAAFLHSIQPPQYLKKGTYTYNFGSTLGKGFYIIKVQYGDHAVLEKVIKI